MSGKQWQNGTFSCFGDARLCIITFLAPCYTVGKNAETLGEDCMLTGLLSMFLPFVPVLRWRLRQEKGIEGSMLMDSVLTSFCSCCTLVQEAREIGWNLPDSIANAGKSKSKDGTDAAPAAAPDQSQDMTRE